MTSNLDSPRDRIAGVLVGVACGDALGAGYEFGPPMAPQAVVDMIGGGPFGFEPGEWTDDTSMAIAIAEVLRTGLDLRARDAQDLIVQRWLDWSHTATSECESCPHPRPGPPQSVGPFRRERVPHAHGTGRTGIPPRSRWSG